MSFTRSTEDVKVHEKLSDYPSEQDGMTTEELKQTFDKPGSILQRDFNKVLDELESSTSANNLGATGLYEGDDPGTIQEKLNKIYESIQSIVLNEIPDGSITNTKLAANAVTDIAIEDGAINKNKLSARLDEIIAYKKDLAVVLGNAKYHTPTITEGGAGVNFDTSLLPVFTSNAPVDGYKVSGTTDAWKALDNNISTHSEYHIVSPTSSDKNYIDLIVEVPTYIRLTKIALALYSDEQGGITSGTCELYGSNDNTNWEFLINPNKSSSEVETNINTTKYYKYFKVRFKNTRGTYYVGIRTFKMVEGYVANEDTYDTFNINLGGLEVYEDYQKLSINVPSTYRNRNLISKVKIDNLETKIINKYIKPNTLIDLTYNGTEFI